MYKLIILALTTSLLITGCGEEEIKSKSYYMKNNTERAEKVKYCNEHPKKAADKNCINSWDAQAQLKMDAMNKDGLSIDYSSAEAKK